MPDPATVATPTPAVAPATNPEPTPTPSQPAEAPTGLDLSRYEGKSLGEALAMMGGEQPASTQSSTPTPTTQPDAGQAATAEPAAGQGDGESATPTQPNSGEPGDGQAPTGPTEDQLLSGLGGKESLEQENARLRRDHGASRDEGVRLNKANEALQGLLKAQDLEVVLDGNQIPKALIPSKEYNDGKATEFGMKFTDLTEDQQKRAETDPQSLIDLVVGRAKKTLIRANPTTLTAVDAISPEREAAIIEHVSSEMFDDGKTLKHPELKVNLPVIKKFIDMPTNEALRDFYNQQPDLALALLDDRLEMVKSFWKASANTAADAAATKKTEADSTPVPGPAGGGEAIILTGAGSPEELGKQMAKAIGAAT